MESCDEEVKWYMEEVGEEPDEGRTLVDTRGVNVIRQYGTGNE